MSTLPERLREAMANARPPLSPADLARAAKVTPAAVSQWLDGTTKGLRAEKAVLIEQATGYRASWIATGRGAKHVSEGNVFDVLTDDERRLLDNFRAMLDEDQHAIAEDVASRAAKMRAYAAKVLERLGASAKPARHHADAAQTTVARAALDVTERLRQQSLLKDQEDS